MYTFRFDQEENSKGFLSEEHIMVSVSGREFSDIYFGLMGFFVACGWDAETVKSLLYERLYEDLRLDEEEGEQDDE